MIPDQVINALVAGIISVVGGWVMVRGNRRTTVMERKLPPYEALSERMGKAEEKAEKQEITIEALRTQKQTIAERLDDVEEDLENVEKLLLLDREWIKRAIVAAEREGAMHHIEPLPEWVDLNSDSLRMRRQRARTATTHTTTPAP